MITIIICSDFYHDEIDDIKKKYPKTSFIESGCMDLVESQPVVFRFPEGQFYHYVTRDRLLDVISGHADDLLIQTSRLFSVEMKRYISEPKYRTLVSHFFDELHDVKDVSGGNVSKILDMFAKKQNIDITEIVNPLKVALIKTTKGPDLPVLMEVLGREEVISRIKKYLWDYKYRI